jgi:hypothetical protein
MLSLGSIIKEKEFKKNWEKRKRKYPLPRKKRATVGQTRTEGHYPVGLGEGPCICYAKVEYVQTSFNQLLSFSLVINSGIDNRLCNSFLFFNNLITSRIMGENQKVI